jgi:hypothetical protein
MTLHEIWTDSVWSKVISAAIGGTFSRLIGLPKRFWRPTLRKTKGYVVIHSGAQYPLKYYLEVENDSKECVAVRVYGYVPNAVTLQKFVPDTLQAWMSGWQPPNTTDVVALLPNQRCRAWVGLDAKFTKSQVETTLEGKMGTLTLTANGKKISFEI